MLSKTPIIRAKKLFMKKLSSFFLNNIKRKETNIANYNDLVSDFVKNIKK